MAKKDVTVTTRETYDKIAPAYSTCVNKLVRVDGWIQKYERTLMDTFTRKLPAKGRILEIGCGNGRDLEYLLEKGLCVTATDFSSGMLAEARKRVPDGNFIQMDMRSLSFSDQSFDGIWANGCIYHIPKNDFKHALNEFNRVLKPNSMLSFNFKIGKGEGLEQTPRSFKSGPRYFAYYSTRGMAKRLLAANFAVSEIEEYPEKILEEKIAQVWARKN
jgi:ubiquinone/menaquinone biosynthesis C-methylase UbiE